MIDSYLSENTEIKDDSYLMVTETFHKYINTFHMTLKNISLSNTKLQYTKI